MCIMTTTRHQHSKCTCRRYVVRRCYANSHPLTRKDVWLCKDFREWYVIVLEDTVKDMIAHMIGNTIEVIVEDIEQEAKEVEVEVELELEYTSS
ncbi:hypothetical protein ACMFMG_001950 [Clarireedia jacksonii]